MEHDAQKQDGISGDNLIDSLPVDKDIIFLDHKGTYSKKIEKRQRTLLAELAFLKKFLLDNEEIEIITHAHSPFPILEQFFGGYLLMAQKRCILVFTNIRILHIPIKGRDRYKRSISQILYSDCTKIATKGRSLIVEYKNGTKESFHYVNGKERKKISTFLKSINFSEQPPVLSARHHLCPECTAVLEKDIYNCPKCGLEFKNKSAGLKISLIFPGGGYFYTGHGALGFFDFLVEIYLPFVIFGFLLQVIHRVPYAAINLIFFSLALIIEKVVSVYHANRFIEEYIPVKDKKTHILSYSVASILIHVALFFSMYFIQQNEGSYFKNYYATLGRYMENRDYDLAEKITLSAIEKVKDYPDDALNLYLVLIKIYEDSQQYDKAEWACQNSLVYIDPGTELYYAVSGMKELFAGNLDKAISGFEACLTNFPDNFASNSYLGGIYFGNFDNGYTNYNKAIKYHHKAYTVDSNDVDNTFRLGVNYFLIEQYDKALEILNVLNEKVPNDGWVCYYLGMSYAMLGQHDNSNRYIEKAIRINPAIADIVKLNK